MAQLIPNTAQFTVKGVEPQGRNWANVYYFLITSPLGSTEANTISEGIQDAYEFLLPGQHTSFHVNSVVATDLSVAGGAQYVYTTGFPLTGSNSNAPLPSQVAGIVSWHTAFRGKLGRGRTYLPGFTEDASGGDGPTSSVQAIITSYASWMLGVGNLVVASRYLGVAPATKGSRRMKPVPRVTGVTNVVTAYQVHNTWATQRRRALRA